MPISHIDTAEDTSYQDKAAVPAAAEFGLGRLQSRHTVRFMRDLGCALSLANLCHAVTWAWLLPEIGADNPSRYLTASTPSRALICAIVVGVLLLAGLFCFAFRTVRSRRVGRTQRLACSFLIGAGCLVALNALRILASNHFIVLQKCMRYPMIAAVGLPGTLVLGSVAAAAAPLALWWWRSRILSIVSAVLLILFPLVPLVMIQMGLAAFQSPVPLTDGQRARPLLNGNRSRVIWLIFDELDYRLAFVDRKVRLPQFDRLGQESLFATNASPPAMETVMSLPALVDGVSVSNAQAVNSNTLLLSPGVDGKPVAWGQRPNVFSRARDLGLNTAVVGWYHPYCRIFGSTLTRCSWCAPALPSSSLGGGFWEDLLNSGRSLVETSLFSPFGQSLITTRHARVYQTFLGRALDTVVDKDMGLVFMHWPIPHAPFIYDRSSGQLTLSNSPVRGYLDNLVLADHALGAVRRALEDANLWDNTTVLVSADHPFRSSVALDGKSDGRVPFLLKLPGRADCFVYTPTFNTVVSHELLLAVVRGEIQTGLDATRWLNHSTTARNEPVLGRNGE